MQGGQGQGDNRQGPLDRSATTGFRRSDLTGGQRRIPDTADAQRVIEQRRQAQMTGSMPALPRRPAGMGPRLDQPPSFSRVARPQREEVRKRRSLGKRIAIWLTILLIGGVIVGGAAYAVTNFIMAVNVSAGAATTANDFLSNVQDANYGQAFKDLDPALTSFTLSEAAFTQKGQADDHCYGKVTNYNETNGSAVSSTNGNVQIFSFAYTITRSKLVKTYQLTLTLQKQSDGSWTITNYGNDLGPAPPTCK